MAQNCEYPGCANRNGTGKSHEITNITGEGKDRVTISLCDSCEGLLGAKDPSFMRWFEKTATDRRNE